LQQAEARRTSRDISIAIEVQLRVQLTERHCSVPDEIRERTRVQVEALAKYQARASAADVVYSEEKNTKKVEVIIHIDGAEPVIGRGDGPEFRTAVDRVVERLRRRLRKQRERLRDHQAPPLSDGLLTE